MSSDLVERLRKASVYEQYKAILSNLGDEAADEIDRLQAEVKTLRNKIASLRGLIEDEEEAGR